MSLIKSKKRVADHGEVFTILCGAPHKTVYAERMIMRSGLRPSTAKN